MTACKDLLEKVINRKVMSFFSMFLFLCERMYDVVDRPSTVPVQFLVKYTSSSEMCALLISS